MKNEKKSLNCPIRMFWRAKTHYFLPYDALWNPGREVEHPFV